MLGCNSYIIEKDGKTIATFLSGVHHDTSRYFVLKTAEMEISVKKIRLKHRIYKYSIINQKTNEAIGEFEYDSSWYNKLLATLTTDRIFRMKQYVVSKLFKPSTWKQCWFRLSTNDIIIDYFGKFNSNIFNGRIEMYGTDRLIEALIGLCIIDEKERTDEEKRDS